MRGWDNNDRLPCVRFTRLPNEKRKNVKEDTSVVLEQAKQTMYWIENIRFVVPDEQWSAELRK